MTTIADRLARAVDSNYVIERELGQGGMATVYLADDVRHHRKVAIKVLHPELSAVLGSDRFLREIQLTANLQHPNILPLFDSGTADGLLYYVMPFIEGHTLRERLEHERQLPVADALRITTEAADALEYAHTRHIVHRDIKPENILLQGGRPLIADFGIALAVEEAGGNRMTQTGLSLGTPQYMSPEQATGERDIGPRSDIYSLGAVTYEMLTGEPPFTGPSSQAIVAKVITTDAPRIIPKRKSVPPHVEAAVLTALEKTPADRFGSAAEFARALNDESFGARRSTSSRSVERGTRAGFIPRIVSRLKDPVFAGMLALTIAAAAFAFFVKSRERRVIPDGVVRFQLVPDRGMLFFVSTQRALDISPDGRQMVLIGRVEGQSERQLLLRSVDDPRLKPLSTEASIMPFFSPDGKWIGFADQLRLRKVSVDGGSALDIAELRGIFGGASWSRKGEIVASYASGLLYAIPENGGEGRRVCRNKDYKSLTEVQPVVLDDGETVLFATSQTTNIPDLSLGVGSLSTGKCKMLNVPAVAPLGVVDDVLIYGTIAGVVMAAPFDKRKQEITGPAVTVLTDVDVNQTTGAMQAALSRTGSLLYVNGTSVSQMMSVDMHGVGQPIIQEVRNYAYPRYSPDGKRIAVAVVSAGQRDIWKVDVASGASSRLTSTTVLEDRPEWTPDGKRILYRSTRGPRSSIWWRASDMSDNESPLLASSIVDYYEAVVTPDGRNVVFQLDTAGADVMYRSITGDTTSHAAAASDAIEDMPRISPDGKWIAFVSLESGEEQVVIRPFPGPGAPVQVSVRGGSEPVWSPDGRRLYYRDATNVIAAELRTTPSLEVASRSVLFADQFVKRTLPHANYDVSPDGTKFLFLKETAGAETILAHNWIAEVRQKLRASAADR